MRAIAFPTIPLQLLSPALIGPFDAHLALLCSIYALVGILRPILAIRAGEIVQHHKISSTAQTLETQVGSIFAGRKH